MPRVEYRRLMETQPLFRQLETACKQIGIGPCAGHPGSKGCIISLAAMGDRMSMSRSINADLVTTENG